jgi:hypothetical protein
VAVPTAPTVQRVRAHRGEASAEDSVSLAAEIASRVVDSASHEVDSAAAIPAGAEEAAAPAAAVAVTPAAVVGTTGKPREWIQGADHVHVKNARRGLVYMDYRMELARTDRLCSFVYTPSGKAKWGFRVMRRYFAGSAPVLTLPC